MNARRSTPIWLLASSLIAAAPLWCGKYLPFADLPEHEAVSAALAHFSDPVWRIREHYTLMFEKTPYWLYDTVGAIVCRLTGDALLAHRLLLTLVCFALPWAMASFLGALGRRRELGALAAPLFWSKSLQFGFVPFIAAIPVLFCALAQLVALLRRPTLGRALGTLGLALLLSMLHSVVYGLFIVIAAGWFVLSRIRLSGASRASRTRRQSLFQWVPFSSLALALPYARIASRGGEGGIKLMAPWTTAAQLPSWSYDLWKGPWDDLASVVFWLGAFVLFRGGYPSSGLRLRGRGLFLGWPLIATLSFALLLPVQVDSVFVVSLRLGPIVACAFLALLHRAQNREARLGMGLMGLAGVLTSLAAYQGVRASQRELGGFDKITEAVPLGSRTYVMNFDLAPSITHFPPWLHLASAVVAQRGGVAQYSFTSLSHWPLVDTASPRKHTSFWFNKPCYFDARDAVYYDSILVRGDYLPLPPKELSGYFLAASAAPFYLWRKLPEGPEPAGQPVPSKLKSPPCEKWGEPQPQRGP